MIDLNVKRILTVLIVLIPLILSAQVDIDCIVNASPFDSLRITSARLYLKKASTGFDKIGVWNESGINTDHYEARDILSAKQICELIEIVSNPDTYGGDELSCFLPEVGIILFDEGQSVVLVIDISFSSRMLRSSLPIPAEHMHDIILGQDNEGDIVLPMTGFSDIGIERLRDLIDELTR